MTQPAAQPASPAGGAYPLTLDFTAGPEVKRWSPLVNWLLAIPHIIVLYALLIGLFALEVVSFFTILFTKQIPDAVFDFQVMVFRYQWRVSSYVVFLRSDYPPFEFDTVRADPGTDPAVLAITKPAEYGRFLPLVKWLLAFPHYVVLMFLSIAWIFVWIAAFFAVLFTARWPEGMRTFTIGLMRWSNRVNAYVYLLVDEYPPFSLD